MRVQVGYTSWVVVPGDVAQLRWLLILDTADSSKDPMRSNGMVAKWETSASNTPKAP